MQIEFIEFYPNMNPKPKTQILGTVHIYIVDFKMDVRGIRVIKSGQNVIFKMPYVKGWDDETGKELFYPVLNFTDQEMRTKLMDHLHQRVKPAIKTILNALDKQNEGRVDPTHVSSKKEARNEKEKVSTNQR